MVKAWGRGWGQAGWVNGGKEDIRIKIFYKVMEIKLYIDILKR